ncbi:MAG TPA: hypothetical protein VKI40_06950 [Terriglobales bacterium]|nr:hypothetical protein [Terriglobales bacterium]
MTFARAITDRYFEDYVEGDVHHFGTISVEADELIAFATGRFCLSSSPLACALQKSSCGLHSRRRAML